ncbi:alpha/beta fold hydrolase [Corallococcus praedator]|uniref:Alpha/beta fold hydrolase n=2 Tax=Corallococcus TaxID=83461 RepID=A0ABX9QAY6_9BACT|nr:alpha/beta hydrolase [Corallococcus praedator]RKH33148.1 alpha/beta fold hydrolase [Corallococcus sp. CA031C]RKH95094.1 alpha/beta fold hydrolase [Corallococcus praedator]
MSYRRSTHFVTAPDGTRVAVHHHDAGLPDAERDRVLAGRPPVLLTNGIGTSENFWRHIVTNLEQDHRVVHWDYRGHGGSDESRDGDYRVKVHVDDLERVTEETIARGNGRPPHHIAFSMGVRILLELYRRRPELVPSMTLIAGTPGVPGAADPRWGSRLALSATRQMLRAGTPWVPVVAPAVKAVIASRFADPLARAVGALRARAPREDIAEFLDALYRMSPQAYWHTLRGLTEGHAWDVVSTVSVPVLIIAARDDVLVPLSEVQRLHRALPQAEWLQVDDAGHAGLLEAGTEISEAVRCFLLVHGLEAPASVQPPVIRG